MAVSEVNYAASSSALFAIDTSGRTHLFLPVTKLWHYRPDVRSLVTGARAVGPEEAGHLVGSLPKPPGRTRAAQEAKAAAWDQIHRRGEVFTTAEVGLTAADVPGHRPITAPGLEALLEARGEQWTIIVRYSAATDRTSPYHVQASYEATQRFPFLIQTRLVEEDHSHQHLIQIRRRY